jgi:hypothetical protein
MDNTQDITNNENKNICIMFDYGFITGLINTMSASVYDYI